LACKLCFWLWLVTRSNKNKCKMYLGSGRCTSDLIFIILKELEEFYYYDFFCNYGRATHRHPNTHIHVHKAKKSHCKLTTKSTIHAAHTHTLSLSFSRTHESFSFSHTHTLSLFLSHAHMKVSHSLTHTLSHSHTLSLCLSFTHTHTLSQVGTQLFTITDIFQNNSYVNNALISKHIHYTFVHARFHMNFLFV
jgi:hypothetical protein